MKTLIVEDSETLNAIYHAYLDGMGLDITAVTSLDAALECVSGQPQELILLDVELPDGNGLAREYVSWNCSYFCCYTVFFSHLIISTSVGSSPKICSIS